MPLTLDLFEERMRKRHMGDVYSAIPDGLNALLMLKCGQCHNEWAVKARKATTTLFTCPQCGVDMAISPGNIEAALEGTKDDSYIPNIVETVKPGLIPEDKNA